jgi:hypothetical protein
VHHVRDPHAMEAWSRPQNILSIAFCRLYVAMSNCYVVVYNATNAVHKITGPSRDHAGESHYCEHVTRLRLVD